MAQFDSVNTSTTGTANVTWTFQYTLPWCQECASYGPEHTHRSRATRPPETPGYLAELYRIVGAKIGDTPAQVRTAYRTRMKAVHPDTGGDTHTAQATVDAYDQLKKEGRAA